MQARFSVLSDGGWSADLREAQLLLDQISWWEHVSASGFAFVLRSRRRRLRDQEPQPGPRANLSNQTLKLWKCSTLEVKCKHCWPTGLFLLSSRIYQFLTFSFHFPVAFGWLRWSSDGLMVSVCQLGWIGRAFGIVLPDMWERSWAQCDKVSTAPVVPRSLNWVESEILPHNLACFEGWCFWRSALVAIGVDDRQVELAWPSACGISDVYPQWRQTSTTHYCSICFSADPCSGQLGVSRLSNRRGPNWVAFQQAYDPASPVQLGSYQGSLSAITWKVNPAYTTSCCTFCDSVGKGETEESFQSATVSLRCARSQRKSLL